MANAAHTGGSTGGADKMKQDLAGDAEQLKDTAKQQAQHKADEGKRQTARTAQATSSAMQSAADELRNDENAPDWLASAVSSAARQVSQLAGQLEDSSPDQIARRSSQFARENPAIFLTASAAAGFAAARFMRAGAEYHSEHESGQSGTGSPGTAGLENSRTGGASSGYSPSTGSATGATGATSSTYSAGSVEGTTTKRTGSSLGETT